MRCSSTIRMTWTVDGRWHSSEIETLLASFIIGFIELWFDSFSSRGKDRMIMGNNELLGALTSFVISFLLEVTSKCIFISFIYLIDASPHFAL